MKVLIASNSTLIRSGIQYLLKDKAQSIASFSNESVEKFIKTVGTELPDVLFFDKDNSEVFNLNTLLDIKFKFPSIKLIVITEVEPAIDLVHCAELGIEACLTYGCDHDEIIKALASVEAGERFFCPKISSKISEGQQFKMNQGCNVIQLTERETEIAKLIADGNTNKKIADMLCISPHTVHTHRKSLMKKIGVSSATEVARYAMSSGLIE